MNHARVKFIFLLYLTFCHYFSFSQDYGSANDRNARPIASDFAGDSATRIVYADQQWSSADSLWFYNVPQGSNLLPYDIFLHLEVAQGNTLFRSDENMNRLRYLPQNPSANNPQGLPVGWVKNEYQGKAFIGFTCAACHTGQIHYRGIGIRIDGAPAMADMDKMLNELAEALAASLQDYTKFTRLAKKVLGARYPGQIAIFRNQLQEITAQLQRYNLTNKPIQGAKTVAYGYARLDAFGRIYNRLLAHLTPGAINFNPPSAPVSYAYLWDAPYQDFVQWNGVGDNEGVGPLARNAGQAMGAFASFRLQREDNHIGYRSSINLRNLNRIEKHLQRLYSPRWEDLAERGILPPIDQALAEQGRAVFLAYQCHHCHQTIDRTDPYRRIIVQFSSLKAIGTDPTAALNAINYQGKSGILQGSRVTPFDYSLVRFADMTPVLPALDLATTGIVLAADQDKHLVRRWSEKAYDLATALINNPIGKTRRHLDFAIVDKNDPTTLAAYKARPLNGIWATAPYLHNGSVANLEELFMPSCNDAQIAGGKACRANRFVIGSREFDPVKVGFVQRDPARYPELFVLDARLPGNSNKGHEFTAGITPVFVLDENGKPVKDRQGNAVMRRLKPITDAQRHALVEYLKTL